MIDSNSSVVACGTRSITKKRRSVSHAKPSTVRTQKSRSISESRRGRGRDRQRGAIAKKGSRPFGRPLEKPLAFKLIDYFRRRKINSAAAPKPANANVLG